jgi:hypothetical protein
MDDTEILHTIQKLVDEEHSLMQQHAATADLSEEQHARMRAIEISLDQCWDLLRQRRARRQAGLNPDDARVRDAQTVEHYLQ